MRVILIVLFIFNDEICLFKHGLTKDLQLELFHIYKPISRLLNFDSSVKGTEVTLQ